MTYNELVQEFKVGYDYIASFQAQGLEPDEIDIFLTKGKLLLIDSLIKQRNYELLNEIIEKQELTLVAENSYYTNEVVGTTSRVCSTSKPATEPYKIIQFSGLVIRTGLPTSNEYRSTFSGISSDEVSKYVTTVDNRPIFREPVYWYEEDKYFITADAFSRISTEANDAILVYVRVPLPITDDASIELNSNLHTKLVEKAVEFAYTTTRKDEAQVNTQLNDMIRNDSTGDVI